ncbi:hypothetical protein [Oricola sp.]|uniref:hypothetical protein n=1 Tax=Oricola sp. TaxID=1979950 RepID=UPI0025F2AD2A|nr:hypothetical protein [Oricola sp.]MCI5078495.1 hypothetical protein [Oricola sp.]
MKIASIMAALAATLTLSLAAQPAAAKDWVEKVAITTDGIDAVSIKVSANASGYTGVKSEKHRFLLRLEAQARKRAIVYGGVVGMYDGVRFGQPVAGWKYSFQSADRTYKKHIEPVIPISQIRWYGADPVQVCKNLMAKKTSEGMTKAQVLSKEWNASTLVFFQFDVMAQRPYPKSSSHERKSLIYHAPVKCLSGMHRAS